MQSHPAFLPSAKRIANLIKLAIADCWWPDNQVLRPEKLGPGDKISLRALTGKR